MRATHRERIQVALSGQKPDEIPIALWRHFPMEDQDPHALAEATLRFQLEFDFDLVKVTPSSSFSVRDWGVEDLWEGDPEITTQKTNEQALRKEKDKSVDWVVVVEASSMAQGEKAAQGLDGYPFRAWGVESIAAPYVYRLLHYFPGPDGR
jgi:hypothetical protein